MNIRILSSVLAKISFTTSSWNFAQLFVSVFETPNPKPFLTLEVFQKQLMRSQHLLTRTQQLVTLLSVVVGVIIHNNRDTIKL
jgi:hypothetical protein